MAWPVDAIFQTFVQYTLITHDFLNELQGRIVDLFGGRKTLKQLEVDGTGDNAAVVEPGVVRAATRVEVVGAGGATPVVGGVYLDNQVVVRCGVQSDGTLMSGSFNVASATRNGVGDYTVTLKSPVNVAAGRSICMAAIINGTVGFATAWPDGGGTTIKVNTRSTGNAATDLDFVLVVMGGV